MSGAQGAASDAFAHRNILAQPLEFFAVGFAFLVLRPDCELGKLCAGV